MHFEDAERPIPYQGGRLRHRIEDLVEARIGVKDIDNRIRVKRHDADWGSERGTPSSGPDCHSLEDSARGLFSQGNDASASNGRSSCSSGEPTKN